MWKTSETQAYRDRVRRVTIEERRSRMAIRHGLVTPPPTTEEAARLMIGLHSSDPSTVFLSVRARIPDVTVDDIEATLYRDRSLVRILGMRRTMWVTPTELAPVIDSSSTQELVATQRARQARLVEGSGLAEDGEAWVQEVSVQVLAALRSDGELTARELTEIIPELGEKITIRKKDGSIQGTVGASTRILFLLATEGLILRAQPLGSWTSSLYRWATVESWLGNPFPQLDVGEAKATLLQAWLRAFGPGTETDIKWWTGWSLTSVRQTLERVAAAEVDLDGVTGYLAGADTDPITDEISWVRFLPSLDPTTMGWKERDWYLGDKGGRLFDRNGNAGPTIWVNGRVVGGWAQRKDGEVVYELMEDVGREGTAAVEDEASRLQKWLGDTTVTPRFRSPHDKNLSA